jgi:hypothetical protein
LRYWFGVLKAKEIAIRRALASGKFILKTARECGTGTSAVQRIRAEMARAKNADP